MRLLTSAVLAVLLSAMSTVMPLSIGGNIAFAMCSGDGSGWAWDDSAKKSCVPCNYNAPLNGNQKRPAFCTAADIVAARISWDYHVADSWTVLLWINGVGTPVPEVWPNGNDRPQSIIVFTDYGIQSGDTICAKVVAHGNGISLESPDPRACVTVPNNGGGGGGGGLSSPMNVNIELSM